MNLKKKIRAFFSFKRRSDGGFTLVELIVVIAILAILAGVGTAGYSGYIKNANKNADKALVGNIMRAIETGTNSTMFVNDDSFVKGATTYPVGIIVLSADGCGVKESTSTVKKDTTECEMVDETFYRIIEKKYTGEVSYESYKNLGFTGWWSDAWFEMDQTYHELEPVSVHYCRNHTNLPAETTVLELGTALTAGQEFTHNGTKYRVKTGTHYERNERKVIDFSLCTGLFVLQDEETGHGTSITREELEALPSGNRITNSVSGNPLYDSIEAAFGDPSALCLSYDGWGVEEGDEHTYATLASSAEEMMGTIKSSVGALVDASNMALIGSVVKGFLSKDYADTADMMNSFASHTLTRYNNNPQKMIDAWNGAKNGGLDYTFGMNDATGYHHDYVYAATKAYNASFASYCKLNATEATKSYIAAIENFSTLDNEGKLAAVNLELIPRTVNATAFSGVAMQGKTLLDQFKGTKEDDTDEQAQAAFDECSKLYQKYVTSDVYEKNAIMMYNTLDTLVKTGTDAYQSTASTDPNKQKAEDHYFAYYENYFKEMGAFYNTIEEQQGKGVIIVVTVENDTVKCDVSPSAANPRND